MPRNLPYTPPTTPFHRAMWLLRPCECRHFYQPAIWVEVFEVKGGDVGNCEGNVPSQQKILAGPYITQSQKQRVYPLKAMVLIGRRALATFLLHETNTSATRQVFGEIFSDAPRLRRPKQKTNDYGTPNKDVGSWKILVFRCDIFLVQKLVPISRNRGGFWVLGKEFPFLLGGSYPTSSTNDPTVREKNVLVVTWDISSQYNPTNHLSNRSVGGNLGNPTGAVNKKKPLAEPVC